MTSTANTSVIRINHTSTEYIGVICGGESRGISHGRPIVKTVKSMTKRRSPGIDTVGVLEVGGNHILSVVLSLYGVVLRLE